MQTGPSISQKRQINAFCSSLSKTAFLTFSVSAQVNNQRRQSARVSLSLHGKENCGIGLWTNAVQSNGSHVMPLALIQATSQFCHFAALPI